MIDKEDYLNRLINKLNEYNIDDNIDYDYIENVIYKAVDDEVNYYKEMYEKESITKDNNIEDEWEEIVDDWDVFDNDILMSVLRQLGVS